MKVLTLSTEVLGFVVKTDLPAGEFRVLTVTSPEGPAAIELLLEPNAHPAARSYQAAIFEDGIPAAIFFVEDLEHEYERLKGRGVRFTTAPARSEWGFAAVFDDTCGNLIGLQEE